MSDHELPFGHIGWACSDEDGPPDCGVWLSLGENSQLWCGEITRELYENTDATHLGSDNGAWIILYNGSKKTVIGKVADFDEAREAFDAMAGLLRAAIAKALGERDE